MNITRKFVGPNVRVGERKRFPFERSRLLVNEIVGTRTFDHQNLLRCGTSGRAKKLSFRKLSFFVVNWEREYLRPNLRLPKKRRVFSPYRKLWASWIFPSPTCDEKRDRIFTPLFFPLLEMAGFLVEGKKRGVKILISFSRHSVGSKRAGGYCRLPLGRLGRGEFLGLTKRSACQNSNFFEKRSRSLFFRKNCRRRKSSWPLNRSLLSDHFGEHDQCCRRSNESVLWPAVDLLCGRHRTGSLSPHAGEGKLCDRTLTPSCRGRQRMRPNTDERTRKEIRANSSFGNADGTERTANETRKRKTREEREEKNRRRFFCRVGNCAPRNFAQRKLGKSAKRKTVDDFSVAWEIASHEIASRTIFWPSVNLSTALR